MMFQRKQRAKNPWHQLISFFEKKNGRHPKYKENHDKLFSYKKKGILLMRVQRKFFFHYRLTETSKKSESW